MYFDVAYKKMEEKLFYKDREVLFYEIKYPHVSGGSMQAVNRINGFYQQTAETYRDRVKTLLFSRSIAYSDAKIPEEEEKRYPGSFFAKLYVVNTVNSPDYYSAYWDAEEEMGEESPETRRFSKTIDAVTGEYIELKDLFSDVKSIKEILTGYIIDEMEKEIKNGEDRYLNDYRSRAVENIRSSNFYLTENSLAVFYQPYDIMLYSAGIKVFEIPFEYLYTTAKFTMKKQS